MKIFSSFPCGNLLLVYFQSENIFDFCLIPSAMQDQIILENKSPESMIQFKLSDSPFGSRFAHTMRNSPCLNELEFLSQEDAGSRIITRFRYGNGLFFHHIVEKHDGWVRVWTEVENQTAQAQHFDQIASFSLGMISPLSDGNGSGKYYLERVTEYWHHEEVSMDRAGMERPNSLRFGTNGTAPVSQYYPFAGIEDRSCGVLWGVMLENSGAWMLEFSSSGKEMSLSGGMPDYAFCGQTFSLPAGASYQTPSAVLSCVKGNILDLFNTLQQCLKMPQSADISPVYYGPYDPSVLSFLKTCGLRYYTLDSGLNSEGLEEIAAAGLIPGVTLDIETVSAELDHPDILTRNGFPLQVGGRVFCDYRNAAQRTELVEKLCCALKERHIGYVRFLCQAVFRGGCDGNKSPLENQQNYIDSVYSFYAELRQKMPELSLEFYGPGIGRFSTKWLALADMVTSSENLPDMAEAMAALDRQMLNPSSKCGVCVPLTSCVDLSFSLNASLLGRPILSGNPHSLSEEQQKTLKQFLAFYQSATPVLRSGNWELGHVIGDSCMSPIGWQVFYKKTYDMKLIAAHTFSEIPNHLFFDAPESMPLIDSLSDSVSWNIHDGKIDIDPCKSSGSAAFLWSAK